MLLTAEDLDMACVQFNRKAAGQCKTEKEKKKAGQQLGLYKVRLWQSSEAWLHHDHTSRTGSQQLRIDDIERKWHRRVLQIFFLDERGDAVAMTNSTESDVQVATDEWWLSKIHQHRLKFLALRLVVGHAVTEAQCELSVYDLET